MALTAWPFGGALASRRQQVVVMLVVSLLVAAALQALGALARPQAAWHDLQWRWRAPPGPLASVLVIDIDEASVQALRPRFGGWPPNRELLALVADYLIDAGARAVAIDIVLDQPRDGDAALARLLAARPGRVLLAAAGLPAGAAGPAAAASPACPVQRWPGLLVPAAVAGGAPLATASSATAVGMVSMPVDADGVLRAMPLWHAGPTQTLQALPLATWLAVRGADAAALRCGDGVASWPGLVGRSGLTLAIDAAGRVRPRLPQRADAVPLRPFGAFASAALGEHDDAALREAVRDRVVFIGASAALGDAVQTPHGARSGAGWLAASYAALDAGALDRAPAAPLDAAWWLLACVPALAAWRRPVARPVADLAWVGAGMAALLVADAAWLALRSQPSNQFGPLLALLLFATLLPWQARRALLAAQSALERARAVAEAANQAKSDFLAHMSHELRTPMNALLGAAELLGRTTLDARQQRHVALFQSAGASLMDILNDLLDLSKIEAGLLELHPQPFSLAELVADLSVLFEARAAQKGLRLLVQFDPALPAVVRGDAPRLAQVLRNLVGNAVKFTHDGSVTLAVTSVAGTAGTAGRLRFEVRDTGVGIAAGRQEAIFNPFTQADSGVARAYGGTGLGLAISRRLVALMGGTIGVASREGEGAVFHIELDLPVSSEAPVADWAHSLPQTVTGPLRPLRILLADDSPHNVILVQAYLEDDGHRIDVVHEGRAAVERWAAGQYDLVLMDVQMPGMDGYRATEALRAIERERGSAPVTVIALTANAMPDDERRSLAAGCTAHLSKPFSRAQLRQLLARHAPDGAGVEPGVMPTAAPASALAALERLDGFELAIALARMGGQPAIYLRVLRAARPMLLDWPERFDAALAGADRTAAHRLAHDLKSVSATIGAVALAEAARGLESLLQDTAAVADARADGGLAACRAEVDRWRLPLVAALPN